MYSKEPTEEELQKRKEASKIPMKVLINTFPDDEHYNQSFESACPEAAAMLSKIGRKTLAVKYEEERYIYETYMPVLYEYYGSKLAYDILMKEAPEKVFYVKEPKLEGKQKKKYDEIVRFRKDAAYDISPEAEDAAIAELIGDSDYSGEIEYSSPAETFGPRVAKMMHKQISAVRRSERKCKSSELTWHKTDILAQALNGIPTSNGYELIDDERSELTMSADEIVMQTYRDEVLAEHYEEDTFECPEERYYYGPGSVNTARQRHVQIQKDIVNSGFNLYTKDRLKHMSDTERNYLSKMGISAEALMTSKQLKKYRKKQKKNMTEYEKLRKKSMKASASVNRSLLDLLANPSTVTKIRR